MDLRELRYISEIGKTRHMTAAADRLFISQPALHKALRKVEGELDTKLFYRRGSELLPTDTGRIVLDMSESVFAIMSQMDDAIVATKNLKRGKVTLGFPSIVGTLYLPELLLQFQSNYPDISLHTVEAGGMELSSLVSSGELDMAIVMRPIYSDTLNEIPLVKNQVVASVSHTHPWASRGYVTVRDFDKVPFNTFDQSFNMRAQLSERFRAEGITPVVTFNGASCQFLYEISTMSNGILVLPKPIIEFYATGNVAYLPFKPAFLWELCLIFPRNTFLSTASKALISHMQEFFLSHLS